MSRHLLLGLIRQQICRTPISQGIKFPLASGAVPLHPIDNGSFLALVSFLTRYPAIMMPQRMIKYLYLAKLAAGVRVVQVQTSRWIGALSDKGSKPTVLTLRRPRCLTSSSR